VPHEPQARIGNFELLKPLVLALQIEECLMDVSAEGEGIYNEVSDVLNSKDFLVSDFACDSHWLVEGVVVV
jgi:hypothetical protein